MDLMKTYSPYTSSMCILDSVMCLLLLLCSSSACTCCCNLCTRRSRKSITDRRKGLRWVLACVSFHGWVQRVFHFHIAKQTAKPRSLYIAYLFRLTWPYTMIEIGLVEYTVTTALATFTNTYTLSLCLCYRAHLILSRDSRLMGFTCRLCLCKWRVNVRAMFPHKCGIYNVYKTLASKVKLILGTKVTHSFSVSVSMCVCVCLCSECSIPAGVIYDLFIFIIFMDERTPHEMRRCQLRRQAFGVHWYTTCHYDMMLYASIVFRLCATYNGRTAGQGVKWHIGTWPHGTW